MCDDDNNNEECGYDGGDCCAKTVEGGKVQKDYCKKVRCGGLGQLPVILLCNNLQLCSVTDKMFCPIFVFCSASASIPKATARPI